MGLQLLQFLISFSLFLPACLGDAKARASTAACQSTGEALHSLTSANDVITGGTCTKVEKCSLTCIPTSGTCNQRSLGDNFYISGYSMSQLAKKNERLLRLICCRSSGLRATDCHWRKGIASTASKVLNGKASATILVRNANLTHFETCAFMKIEGFPVGAMCDENGPEQRVRQRRSAGQHSGQRRNIRSGHHSDQRRGSREHHRGGSHENRQHARKSSHERRRGGCGGSHSGEGGHREVGDSHRSLVGAQADSWFSSLNGDGNLFSSAFAGAGLVITTEPVAMSRQCHTVCKGSHEREECTYVTKPTTTTTTSTTTTSTTTTSTTTTTTSTTTNPCIPPVGVNTGVLGTTCSARICANSYCTSFAFGNQLAYECRAGCSGCPTATCTCTSSYQCVVAPNGTCVTGCWVYVPS